MPDRSTETIVDPATGEVLDAATVARHLAAVTEEWEAVSHQLRNLNARRAELDLLLRTLQPQVGDVWDAGDWSLVASPPKARPPVRVNAEVAERYADKLLARGLGRPSYKPPTAAELRKLRAEVIADGVPWDQLLPEPPAGPVELVLVRKAAA